MKSLRGACACVCVSLLSEAHPSPLPWPKEKVVGEKNPINQQLALKWKREVAKLQTKAGRAGWNNKSDQWKELQEMRPFSNSCYCLPVLHLYCCNKSSRTVHFIEWIHNKSEGEQPCCRFSEDIYCLSFYTNSSKFMFVVHILRNQIRNQRMEETLECLLADSICSRQRSQ